MCFDHCLLPASRTRLRRRRTRRGRLTISLSRHEHLLLAGTSLRNNYRQIWLRERETFSLHVISLTQRISELPSPGTSIRDLTSLRALPTLILLISCQPSPSIITRTRTSNSVNISTSDPMRVSRLWLSKPRLLRHRALQRTVVPASLRLHKDRTMRDLLLGIIRIFTTRLPVCLHPADHSHRLGQTQRDYLRETTTL